MQSTYRGFGTLAGDSAAPAQPTADNTAVSQAVDNYLSAAKDCIDAGKQCDQADLLEAAAIAGGLDPAMIDAFKKCTSDSPGATEACSQFAVTQAAVGACTVFTAGLGTAICLGAVPTVVEIIWPLIGPIANGITDGIKGLGKGAVDALSDIGEGLLDMFGGGSHKNTDVGVAHQNMQYAGKVALNDARDKVVEGLVEVVNRTRSELGLPATSVVTWPDNIGRNLTNACSQVLDLILMPDPLWSGTLVIPAIAPPPISSTTKVVPFRAIGFVDWLGVKGPSQVWQDWYPAMMDWPSGTNAYGQSGPFALYGTRDVLFALDPAMKRLCELRLTALQNAVPKAIGKIIAYSAREKELSDPQTMRAIVDRVQGLGIEVDKPGDKFQTKEKSSALKWVAITAALAGLGYAGYRWHQGKSK